MLTVDEQERIRHAYYTENKSMRAIERETGISRKVIAKAIATTPPKSYQLSTPRSAPVFGPYQARVEELLALNEHLPHKQRYTVHKIFELIQSEGYQGCESRVGQHCAQWHKERNAPKVYLPLEFEPGRDAQCDWGEAVAIIGGIRQTVQVFVLNAAFLKGAYIKVRLRNCQ